MLKKSLAGVAVAAVTCGLIAFAGTAADAAPMTPQAAGLPGTAQLCDGVSQLQVGAFNLVHDGLGIPQLGNAPFPCLGIGNLLGSSS